MKSKLVREFLNEGIVEDVFNSEKITPQEFIDFVEYAINLNNPSKTYNLIKQLFNVHKYIHDELGEREGHDKYIEGYNIFDNWFQGLSQEEFDEIEKEYNKETKKSWKKEAASRRSYRGEKEKNRMFWIEKGFWKLIESFRDIERAYEDPKNEFLMKKTGYWKLAEKVFDVFEKENLEEEIRRASNKFS